MEYDKRFTTSCNWCEEKLSEEQMIYTEKGYNGLTNYYCDDCWWDYQEEMALETENEAIDKQTTP